MGTSEEQPSTSAIGHLLDEISYEGNAKKYRGGGLGLENVLTTEVFSALDFLPRQAFLGEVLHSCHGADAHRLAVASAVEVATLDILPGDIRPVLDDGHDAPWQIQPDVLIESAESICLVEAKRIRRSYFQQQQIARTTQTILHLATGRPGFVLFVLGDPPPVRVAKMDRIDFAEALEVGLGQQGIHWSASRTRRVINEYIAWTTWEEISRRVSDAAGSYPSADPAVNASISRLALSIASSVARHG